MINRTVIRFHILPGIGCLIFTPIAVALSVSVDITNVQKGDGPVMIALCVDPIRFKQRNCQLVRKIKASSKSVEVSFSNIKPSGYAAIVYQDLNNNGQFDKNFFGIPEEPFGFSGNPNLKFGAPDFLESRVLIEKPHTRIPITLIGNK